MVSGWKIGFAFANKKKTTWNFVCSILQSTYQLWRCKKNIIICICKWCIIDTLIYNERVRERERDSLVKMMKCGWEWMKPNFETAATDKKKTNRDKDYDESKNVNLSNSYAEYIQKPKRNYYFSTFLNRIHYFLVSTSK